jgi:hypothetical protein
MPVIGKPGFGRGIGVSNGIVNGLTINVVSATRNDLSWLPTAGADGYDVERSTDGGVTWSFLTQVTATSYSDTGLSQNTTYYYRVRAFRNDLAGAAQHVATQPGQVTGFGVRLSPTQDALLPAWTALNPAPDLYSVERSLDGSTGWAEVGTPAGTSFTDTGRTLLTPYYYRVRAKVGASYGAYSPTCSGLTVPLQSQLLWGSVAGVGDYQESTFATVAGADADPVGGVRELTAGAKDPVQATAGKRLVLKTGVQNGKPGLLGNSATDEWVEATGFTALNGIAGYTAFIVSDHVNNTSNQFDVHVGDAATNVRLCTLQLSGGTLFAYAGVGSTSFGQKSAPAIAVKIREVVYDGSQAGNTTRLKLFENGVQVTFDSFGGTAVPATLGTGDRVSWMGVSGGGKGQGGHGFAVLLYPLLSSGDRDSVRNALNAYYAVF